MRRINLFGGPSSGKSTLAAALYGLLKSRGTSVELVREYVKGWAYSSRPIKRYDQLYILAKQLHAEFQVLACDVQLIVTDAPLWLNCYYAFHYDCPCLEQMYGIATQFDIDFPALNILLNRPGFAYAQAGRYQTEQEAIAIDGKIAIFLDCNMVSYVRIDPRDLDSISRLIPTLT